MQSNLLSIRKVHNVRQADRYLSSFFVAVVAHDFDVFLVALDGDKECARDIHIQCAASLVKADTDLCSSVNNFVTCHDNFIEGSSPLPSTYTGPEIPDITKQFDKVIDHFSKYLIRVYRENPQSMCQVASEVLDGDCMAK